MQAGEDVASGRWRPRSESTTFGWWRLFVADLSFEPDPLINLFAMNLDTFGSIDPETDVIAFHAEHGYTDYLANHYGLADSPRKDQHSERPSVRCAGAKRLHGR